MHRGRRVHRASQAPGAASVHGASLVDVVGQQAEQALSTPLGRVPPVGSQLRRSLSAAIDCHGPHAVSKHLICADFPCAIHFGRCT